MKTALFTLVASFCGVTASAIQPGMIDLSFNSGGEGTFEEVHSLAVQPDGKILIGGDFTEFNGVSRNRLARLLVNGKLDPAFDQVEKQDARHFDLLLRSLRLLLPHENVANPCSRGLGGG
jgi:hypothetical protein